MKLYPAQFTSDAAPILLAQAHGDSQEDLHQTTEHQADAHSSAGHSDSEHGSPWEFFGFSLLAFFAITLFAILGTRKMLPVPHKFQNAVEMVVEALYGIPEMVMGERGRQFAPFVGTFFVYILVMNFMGLIPWMKPGTASLSVTLGMSIVAFVAVQYFGFKAHGFRYLAHFLGPVPAMAFLIMPLELISEIARPVSLSMRLYGNIYGEEQVIGALATFFNPAVAVLMLPLQVLTSFLQAFVFTLLVTVYIALATEKHDDESHGASSEAAAH